MTGKKNSCTQTRFDTEIKTYHDKYHCDDE